MILQYLLKNFLDLKVEIIHQNIKATTDNTPQSYKLEQLLLNKHSAMNSIQTLERFLGSGFEVGSFLPSRVIL
jgi:hypothetical protein